jgi:hypothetical protein
MDKMLWLYPFPTGMMRSPFDDEIFWQFIQIDERNLSKCIGQRFKIKNVGHWCIQPMVVNVIKEVTEDDNESGIITILMIQIHGVHVK